MDPLTAPPSRIAVGTTVKVTRTYSDFPADEGWALEAFLSIGSAVFQAAVAINADGKSFDITIPSDATLTPGTWEWLERATKGDEVFDPLQGVRVVVQVTPRLTSPTAGAYLSWEEHELALIRDLLADRLTADVQAYQIDGTALTRIPIDQIWKRASWLEARIAAKQTPGPILKPIPLSYARLGGH